MYPNKILLVDDQPAAAESSIESLCHFVPRECILYANDAAAAMDILTHERPDLIFLDIDMPGTDGFSLADYLGKQHAGIPYVFLTGYADFAARSYDYEPLDFLVKPIDLVRLRRTFERLERHAPALDLGKVAVQSEQGLVLIDPEEILYVAKDKRKTIIHCLDCQYLTDYTLEELEVVFNEHGLFRCHQSYLLSVSKIVALHPARFGQTFEAGMDGGAVVPVSRARYPILQELLQKSGVRFLK